LPFALKAHSDLFRMSLVVVDSELKLLVGKVGELVLPELFQTPGVTRSEGDDVPDADACFPDGGVTAAAVRLVDDARRAETIAQPPDLGNQA